MNTDTVDIRHSIIKVTTEKTAKNSKLSQLSMNSFKVDFHISFVIETNLFLVRTAALSEMPARPVGVPVSGRITLGLE